MIFNQILRFDAKPSILDQLNLSEMHQMCPKILHFFFFSNKFRIVLREVLELTPHFIPHYFDLYATDIENHTWPPIWDSPSMAFGTKFWNQIIVFQRL